VKEWWTDKEAAGCGEVFREMVDAILLDKWIHCKGAVGNVVYKLF
jgi:hypothetical protein